MKNLILTILIVLGIQNIYGQKNSPIKRYTFKSAIGIFKTPTNTYNPLSFEGAIHFNLLPQNESSLNVGILRSHKMNNQNGFDAFYFGYNYYFKLFNKEISKTKHLLQIGIQSFNSSEYETIKKDNDFTYSNEVNTRTLAFPLYYITRFDLSDKVALSTNIGGEIYLENYFNFNIGLGIHFR